MNTAAMLKAFKRFDYFSCSIGLIGTLLISGLVGHMPIPIVVFSGVISSMICLFSVGLLSMNLFLRYLKPIEKHLYALHALSNLAPTLYLLAHLTETPWGKFTS